MSNNLKILLVKALLIQFGIRHYNSVLYRVQPMKTKFTTSPNFVKRYLIFNIVSSDTNIDF